VKPGVNVYGYVYAESGVGQVTRLLVEALRSSDVDYRVVPVTKTLSRQETAFSDFGSTDGGFDINIICVNADQVPVFVEDVGRTQLTGRYNIGYWAWETEDFPDWMAESARFLDEVWGISSFTAGSIENKVDVPVHALPLPIRRPTPAVKPRFDLGLPESFLYFFCFDLDSVFGRKNPLAVIDAFKRAFPQPVGAHLFLKSINGERHPEHVDALTMASGGRPDVTYRDGYSGWDEQLSLMASCDAYVSLHRSEGFGLTMGEAMALGKPVIATQYSGNLDFMNEGNSFLVPFDLVSVGTGNDPYPGDAVWAEPDVAAAALLMRRVMENQAEVREKAEVARTEIASVHGPAARGELILERLKAVQNGQLARHHGDMS
jgi:glycosyltransferase involved in cell wall biosynthesis